MQLESGGAAAVGMSELKQSVADAIAAARGHAVGEWDLDAADVAIRRWRSFERRHVIKHALDQDEQRVADLAKGLLERMDPDRMDEPGWHEWSAVAAAQVLRER